MGDNGETNSRVGAEFLYYQYRTAIALEEIAALIRGMCWGLIFGCFVYTLTLLLHRGEE